MKTKSVPKHRQKTVNREAFLKKQKVVAELIRGELANGPLPRYQVEACLPSSREIARDVAEIMGVIQTTQETNSRVGKRFIWALPAGAGPPPRPAAELWLESYLADGLAERHEVQDEGNAAGHNDFAIMEAARALGVDVSERGPAAIWCLPER